MRGEQKSYFRAEFVRVSLKFCIRNVMIIAVILNKHCALSHVILSSSNCRQHTVFQLGHNTYSGSRYGFIN
jgi:hypothetical protein